MIDDDFLLDEEDEFEDGLSGNEENSFDEDDPDNGEKARSNPRIDSSVYEGKMSTFELDLIKIYDSVSKSLDIKEACSYVVNAIPAHTSSATAAYVIKDMFHLQGHHRMVNTLDSPKGLLSSEELATVLGEEDDDDFNALYAREAQDLITRFIGYLADRDLSEESISSLRRKKRQIPAFIIFLFSSGMYDLIMDCPTLPEYYRNQVKEAFKKINEKKYEVVKELAKKYEEVGRHEVAVRVNELGVSWFDHEPAEIKTNTQYRDLGITNEDVEIYRQYRSKFTNISKALTLETVSGYIDVVVDAENGIYEKLKDKTRTEAINDVKAEYKRFVEREDPSKSEIANKVIFKTLRED